MTNWDIYELDIGEAIEFIKAYEERTRRITNTLGWRPTCECKWMKLKQDVPQPIIDKVKHLAYNYKHG